MSTLQVAADLLPRWRASVLNGDRPERFPLGDGPLAEYAFGPGRVLVLGGAPKAGKTAFTMQAVTDALRLTPSLRALVANVEMAPEALLDRQLGRLSGVDVTTIQERRLGPEHTERIDVGMATLEAFADRLAFLKGPFTLDAVGDAATAFEARLVVLDYLQRFTLNGAASDGRMAAMECMQRVRYWASAGAAVFVVSAVGRTRDARGRSGYSGEDLTLASFRESSELEFGGDDAFILHRVGDSPDRVNLNHLASRYGQERPLLLDFNRRVQSFTPTQQAEAGDPLEAAFAIFDAAEPKRG